MITSDGRLLIASRGTRGFIDGAVAVTLSAYLTSIGYSGARIGVIVTGMLLGSALLTLLTGTSASGFARRTLLQVGSLLMIATGLVFATTQMFGVLLVVGFIGTVNPTSGDVSVFQPIEQSLLPNTTDAAGRTRLFAIYTFAGSLCAAAGLFSAGIPEHFGWSLRTVFVVYAAGGAVALLIYRTLSSSVEPHGAARPAPLGESRPIVYRLAALFSLDAFGGGFTVQSLLALWLFERFGFTLANAGLVLGTMGVLSAASGLLAARIERRIGPIRTMVFTHLPAQVLLIAAAFMPTAKWAVACLLARSLLASMDVPVRNAFVMSVVTPAERAAAASVTNVPRSLVAAVPPFLAGWMLDRSTFGWPLIIAGVLKITYDLLLLRMGSRRGSFAYR
ncbi:MAG: MFS transporter [Actinomycetota bacterium]|jgi:predicted MFS family arabinose efflux permease